MFKPRTLLFAILGSLVTLAACSQPSGSWSLNADSSSLSFVSVKNSSVLEASHFGTLTGSVSEEGNAHVAAQTEERQSELDQQHAPASGRTGEIGVHHGPVRQLVFEPVPHD